jgi:hypothetical protein
MKAAGASAGALFGGSTVIGSAVGQTGDRNCFQVDLIEDSDDGVRDPLSDSNKYSDDGRLIAYQWGSWENDLLGSDANNQVTYDQTCDVTVTSDISVDFSVDEATVEVDVNNCGSGSSADFALVSYKAPCGNPNDPTWTGSTQAKFAATKKTVSESDGPTTLTVEIPGDSPDVPQESNLQVYYPLNTVDGTNYIDTQNVDRLGSPTTGVDGVVPSVTQDAYQFTTNGDTNTAGDAISSPNSLDVNGSSGTVAAWFQYTGKEATGRVLQVGGTLDTVPDDGYNIEFNGSNDELQLAVFADESASTTSTISVSKGTFYFVVAVVGDSNGEARFHVFSESGGELSGSPVTVSDSRGTGDSVLHMMAGDGRDVAGTMDEVFGYNTALTPTEVTELRYNSTDEAPVTNTTQGTDHSTIQGAVDAANSGDTIEAEPATYNESVTIDTNNITLQQPSGAASQPFIDSRGQGGPSIEIDGSNGGDSGVTVDGFLFNSDASTIVNTLNMTDFTIKNCTVAADSGTAVDGMFCDGVVTVDNCGFFGNKNNGNDSEAILLQDSTSSSQSSISNCTFDGFDFGLRLNGCDNVTTNSNTISNNLVNGIQIVNSSNNIDINNADIDDNGENGVLVLDSGSSPSGSRTYSITINDSNIDGTSNSQGFLAKGRGVRFDNSENIEVRNCGIGVNTGNRDGAGIRGSGGTIDASTISFKQCDIVNNDFGMFTAPDGGTVNNNVDATKNYWGADDGPSNDGGGSGQGIAGKIEYVPWLEDDGTERSSV